MDTRSASPPRESGPISIATGVRYRTSWTALLFSGIAGLALVTAATTFPLWSEALVGDGTASVKPPPLAATAAAHTPVPTAPPADGLASKWVGQSATPVIVEGGTAALTFVFRNAGTAEWRRGSPSEVRLGIVGPYNPAMAVDWPFPERPAIQQEPVVRPGEQATFTFEVRGASSGVFRLRLRPVVDGVAWLTDEGVYVEVEVR